MLVTLKWAAIFIVNVHPLCFIVFTDDLLFLAIVVGEEARMISPLLRGAHGSKVEGAIQDHQKSK